MYTDASSADRDVVRPRSTSTSRPIDRLESEIKVLLLPRDPNDDKNVIVEIRGAEGGEEANLFARDLFEMYQAYAARQGWKVEVLGSSPSDMGGFSEIAFLVKGDGVWTRLKHEGGPHRVQRVPVTESQGRIHTSSATVTVLPEAEEVDVQIDPNDLDIDVYRSSGPGGQSVNTTDSAVRITHRPDRAWWWPCRTRRARSRTGPRPCRCCGPACSSSSRTARAPSCPTPAGARSAAGGRSEKIRTYNFKENRVTDHRIGLTLYKLDKVLAGELDEVVDALVADERSRQLQDDGPA